MDEAARDRLASFLTERRGTPTAVTAVRRITVGHSRAMYRVDADGGPYVLRVEQGGVFGTSGAEEARVMRGLHAAGYPVAEVLWEEPTGAVLGRPFFVMAFVEGAGAQDERAMDPATAERFVAMLDRLHRLDWQAAGLVFDVVPDHPSDATHHQVDRWAGVYRAAAPEPIPLLEEAAAWLHHHAPPLERLAVVHGDAGPGNVVTAGGGVRAVTDWEFAHLGDPAEDWAFCLTMRGVRTMPRDDWLALFRRVAGVELPPAEWAYWEAFNLFKGACANRSCLTLFEEGANRAPNMAIIGTALHQVFLRRLADLVAAPATEEAP